MKRITMITGRMDMKYLRLQPWRYLHEVACQLSQHGHPVTIVSDGAADAYLDGEGPGLQIRRIPSVNRYHWQPNPALQQAVEESQPDVILWHLGVLSFLHQRMHGWPDVPVVGIFPGIVYKARDFRQVGARNLINEFALTWIHMLGAVIPRSLMRKSIENGWLQKLVTLSQTTRSRLIERGLPAGSIQTISPGVDDLWFHSLHQNGFQNHLRAELGFAPHDKVILYFGSPQPLRGLHDLIRAVEIAHPVDQSLKLLILSRRREDELLKENAGLKSLLEHSPIRSAIKVVSGFLDPEKLVEYMAVSDAVALPFQLVPADGPLSVLEAQAQRKPVITTRVASLPEMVAGGAHYLANPADPASLAAAVMAAAQDIEAQRKHNSPQRALSPSLRGWRQVGAEWSQLVQSL